MSIQKKTEKYKRLIRSEKFQDKLRNISIPGFEGIPIYDVFVKFKEEIKNDDLSIRASSISFYFILALFPTIIFFFSLIPYVPITNFDEKIMHGLKSVLPINAFIILESTIHNIVSRQHGGVLSINFFLALFVASNGVNSMMKTFDKMNHTFKTRNWWQKRFAAIRILVLVCLQIIIAVLLIIKGNEFLAFLLRFIHAEDEHTLFVLHIVKLFLIVFSFFNIIALIYYYGPSVKKKYRYFSVGATFATIISIIMTYGFQVYASYLNNFNRLFGSLGIMIVIMMLIYLNALVLLFGFELNNSIAINKTLRNNNSDNHTKQDEC
ncbi:MAG: YihY/virulence factor BrkB family protein [Chitinophagales bacterium]|nr:YihY/virulence factor BrkB family protein [Chitinophagales bacterium]